MDDVAAIAAGLSKAQEKWLTGNDGPSHPDYRKVGMHMARMRLTASYSDWSLSERGLAVRKHIMENDA